MENSPGAVSSAVTGAAGEAPSREQVEAPQEERWDECGNCFPAFMLIRSASNTVTGGKLPAFAPGATEAQRAGQVIVGTIAPHAIIEYAASR